LEWCFLLFFVEFIGFLSWSALISYLGQLLSDRLQ